MGKRDPAPTPGGAPATGYAPAGYASTPTVYCCKNNVVGDSSST